MKEEQEGNQLTEKQQRIISKHQAKYRNGKGPLETRGLISRAFFGWMDEPPLQTKEATIQQDHLYNLRKIDTGEYCYEAIKAQWTKRHPNWFKAPGTGNSAWDLVATVLSSYPSTFILFASFSIVLSAIEFMNAQIMKMALDQLQHQSNSTPFIEKLESTGKLIFILIFSQVGLTVLQAQNNLIIRLLTERIKHGVNGLVFAKVMKKSIQRDLTYSIGQIANLTQVDVRRVSNMSNFINRIVVAPIEIVAGLIWIYLLIGNAALFGLPVIFVSMYLNLSLAKRYKLFRAKYMSSKDKRGKLVSEVFGNIRFIKMAGLENVFFQKVQAVKKEELYWVMRDYMNDVLLILLAVATPDFFLATLFSASLYLNGNLTVSLVFTVMQIYNIFRMNFNSLPFMVTWVVDLTVSCERLTLFLLSENIDTSYIRRLKADEDRSDYAVEVENGSFYWEDADLKELYEIEKDRIAELAQKNKKKEENDEKEESKKRTISKKQKAMVALRLQISNILAQGKKSFGTGSVSDRASTLSVVSLGLTRNDFGDLNDLENYSKFTDKLSKYTDEDRLNEPLMDRVEPHLLQIYSGITLNLKNINIRVPKGKCVAVIGKVGSGKSSLLSCLTGEMYKKVGARIKIAGKAAYVSQKAWIPSLRLKDCVTFGEPFNQLRFENAIKYSCMTEDLKILAKGADTVLGDKGVNLSGGQKIRLSIARSMYSQSDVYLFDDPISALDIDVGKVVMEEGILGFLGGTTRIVATHALAYLPMFDYVYVIDGGEIVEEGTYEEIRETAVYQGIVGDIDKQRQVEIELDRKKEEEERQKDEEERKTKIEGIKALIGEIDAEEAKNETEEATKNLESETAPSQDSLSEKKDSEEEKAIEDIIKAEDRVRGSLSWRVVGRWLSLIGGLPRLILMMILLTVVSLSRVGAPFFLQYWATEFEHTKMSRFEQLKTFLGIYMSINLLEIAAHSIRVLITFLGNLEMSREVNFMMTFRLMHASVNKYFDRVPMGRLLNRFLSDVEVIDTDMGWSSIRFFSAIFNVITSFSVACLSSSPGMFILVVLFVRISFQIQRYYMNLNREIVRLRSISSSPIIQEFKEGLEGVSTIRVFEKTQKIFANYFEKVDDYQKNAVASTGATNWFKVRIALLTLTVVLPIVTISLFAVNLPVGLFGLMLNFVLEMAGNVRSLLSNTSNQESKLISLERCLYFMKVPPEAGYKGLKLLERELRSKKEEIRIDPKKLTWPSTGDLSIQNLSVRYRRGLPYVLKDINLDIKSGSKVGIVGRTGAGKSTLISAIYKTLEEYKGNILIDGKNIREIDLKILRSSMTIIPQDPYLFEDSIKNNIDPASQFPDEKVKDILKDIGLWQKFTGLDGLDSKIEKGGSNLSQGEKQLICLARALLLENRLVLMDEATANIDSKTESLIQDLVKRRFKDCTILMIAHRLNTILNCDQVLVLDQGKVVEFDHLKNLKGNHESWFGRMLLKSEEIHESLK